MTNTQGNSNSNVNAISVADKNNNNSQSELKTKVASIQVANKKYGITSLDVWALGITVVIGGQYFSWNFGLSAGVGTYGIALLLIIVGYTCLILCISEISSGLPFAGGSYGLARCTLGNYWGFLLGCSETIEYIFYVATAVHFLGVMIELLIPGSHDYAPVTWLVTYIVSLLIYIFGGKYFWNFNMFLAIVSIGIEIMFCFGSLKYVDFTQYAAYPATGDQNPWFTGNMSDFMKVMPIAAWFFVGVEALKETCNDLDEPKLQIPRGQVSCVLTLAVLAIMVYFITVSLPPGIVSLSTNNVPFNLGFQLMFNLSDEQTLRYATILSIPATFATCFGFIMMYGKIITAMAESKLMPSILSRRYSKTGAPYLALCAGSLASYGVCLVCYVYEDMVNQLFNISILAAFFGYSSQCLCYILLKTKYSNIKCDFQSPFGIYGAIVALCIWTLGAISIIGFQDDGQKALIAVVIIYGTLTIWYFAYAKSRQSFSDEEKKIFFTIHIINYNSSKKSPSKQRRYIKNLSDKMRNQSDIAAISALFARSSSKKNVMSGLTLSKKIFHHKNSSEKSNSNNNQSMSNQYLDSDEYMSGGGRGGGGGGESSIGGIGGNDSHKSTDSWILTDRTDNITIVTSNNSNSNSNDPQHQIVLINNKDHRDNDIHFKFNPKPKPSANSATNGNSTITTIIEHTQTNTNSDDNENNNHSNKHGGILNTMLISINKQLQTAQRNSGLFPTNVNNKDNIKDSTSHNTGQHSQRKVVCESSSDHRMPTMDGNNSSVSIAKHSNDDDDDDDEVKIKE